MSIDMRKHAISVVKKLDQDSREDGGPGLPAAMQMRVGADRSFSMRSFYDNPNQPLTGLTEHVIELGLAGDAVRGPLDPDGRVWFGYYSSGVMPLVDRAGRPTEVTLANLRGERFSIIEEFHHRLGGTQTMGSTNTTEMVRHMTDEHLRDPNWRDMPALHVLQFDGQPNDQGTCMAAFREASRYNIAWALVLYGNDPQAVRFADYLDNADYGQLVDNVTVMRAGDKPWLMPSDELYHGLLKEVPKWRAEARLTGVEGTV